VLVGIDDEAGLTQGQAAVRPPIPAPMTAMVRGVPIIDRLQTAVATAPLILVHDVRERPAADGPEATHGVADGEDRV
jgi:hypothetical protein